MLTNLRYAALMLMLLAGTANSETFECQSGSGWSEYRKIVVVATGNDNGTGEIKVAGVTYKAFYCIEGFNRRWDFGSDTDVFALFCLGVAAIIHKLS